MIYTCHSSIFYTVWCDEFILLHQLSGDTYYYSGIAKDVLCFCFPNNTISSAKLIDYFRDSFISEKAAIEFINSLVSDLIQKNILILAIA